METSFGMLMANVIETEAYLLANGQMETRSGMLMASAIVKEDFRLLKGQTVISHGGSMATFTEITDYQVGQWKQRVVDQWLETSIRRPSG
jgi:hypothetical protein